jgi:predicted membrane protein
MTQEQMNTKQRKFNERLLIGLTVIVVGVLILLRNLNFPFPDFLFTWPMIVILIGVFSGIKDKFQTNNWWILTALGVFFLSRNFLFPEFNLKIFFWPAILIAVGLSFVFNRGRLIGNRRRPHEFWKKEDETFQESTTVNATGEDVIDAVAVFGSVKKNIYSKNFKGGELVNVFGGSEINLTNADFTGEVKLEIVNIFGGATLIVPPHWQIRSQAAAVFGGIEDKRPRPVGVSTDKVLIIDGFVMMGGIDIKS